MKLQELLAAQGVASSWDTPIFGLQSDSRRVVPGDLFLAFPGASVDGRSFIEEAINAGAVAVLYDPEGFFVSSSMVVPCIAMPALGSRVAAIASFFYGEPSHHLSVVGVTGTNGKTTIAYQLAQAYAYFGRRAAYVGTLGEGLVGALRCLQNTTPDALTLQHCLSEYQQTGFTDVCMEVSSHALVQQRTANIVFRQALYTQLSHDHLDYHQTIQAYAEAKAMLFTTPSLEYAVINADDAFAALMQSSVPKTCRVLTYGLYASCDFKAENIVLSMHGSTFDVCSSWGRVPIKIKTLGLFNVYNALAVYVSLVASGFDRVEIGRVMAQLEAAPGRMEVVTQTPCVVVDYAHTPDALDNVLKTLVHVNRGKPSSKIWVVFGCGGDRDALKRPMMGRVAAQHADHIVLTSDNPRTESPSSILNAIASGIDTPEKVSTIMDRQEAIYHALGNAKPDDVILIAGKGHETYQQIGLQRFAFSDQAVVRGFFGV